MDGAKPDTALMDAVQNYCYALHFADGAALEALCDARFLMHSVGSDGQPRVMDEAKLFRVASGPAIEG